MQAVLKMLPERLPHIRNHCPVKMCRAHTAELLQGLELEDYRHELECSIYALRWADIRLAGIEAVFQQVVEWNREAVM